MIIDKSINDVKMTRAEALDLVYLDNYLVTVDVFAAVKIINDPQVSYLVGYLHALPARFYSVRKTYEGMLKDLLMTMITEEEERRVYAELKAKE